MAQKIKGLDCILLIDDDTPTNFLHQIVIKKANIDAHIVLYTNAEKALDYINHEKPKPDLIFLDINMPGMNGYLLKNTVSYLLKSVPKL